MSKTKVLLILLLSFSALPKREKSFSLCIAHICEGKVLNENDISWNSREDYTFLPEQTTFFPPTSLKQRLNLFFGALSCVGGSVRTHLYCKSMLNTLFLLFHFIAGYFWHITDLHFDSAYSTKGDIVRSRFTDEKLIDLQFYEKHVKAFIQLSFIDFSASAVYVFHVMLLFLCAFSCVLCFSLFGRKQRNLGQHQHRSRMGLLNVINIMIIYDFHKNTEIYDSLSIVFHLLFNNCLRYIFI
jgi:hypothetical protein